MSHALVVHTDALVRNALRLALERAGLEVRTAPSPGAAPRADGAWAVAVVPASEADFARALAGEAASLVLVGAEEALAVADDLGAALLLSEPLDPARLDQAFATLRLPGGGGAPGDGPWDGALRRERKAFVRSLEQRVGRLRDAIAHARRTERPQDVAVALDLLDELGAQSARFRFPALSELSTEARRLLTAIAEDPWASDRDAAWERLLALTRVLEGIPVRRVLDQRTVDDAQVLAHRRVVVVLHPEIEVLLSAAAIAERNRIGLLSARLPEEALRLVATHHVDAVFLPDDLPDRGTARLVGAIRALPGRGSLPLAFLGDRPPDPEDLEEVAARTHGVVTLGLPLRERSFVQAVERLVRTTPLRSRAVVIEPHAASRRVLREVFAAEGVEVLELDGAPEAVWRIEEIRPDVVILPAEGPGRGGFELVRALRERPSLLAVPVIVILPREDEVLREAAVRAGADDTVARPLTRGRVLAAALGRMQRWRRLRRSDGRLGVLSREAFLEGLADALPGIGRPERPVVVGLVDLREFRVLNASRGFAVGDRVLATMAKALTGAFGAERVARWGPDQLAVLMVGVSKGRAEGALHDAVRVFHGDRLATGVEVRSAVVVADDEHRAPEALMAEAERALRRVKGSGQRLLARLLARAS